MVRGLPKIDVHGEVDDLSEVDSSVFRPASEALPATLIKKLGIRDLRKAPPKKGTTNRSTKNNPA